MNKPFVACGRLQRRAAKAVCALLLLCAAAPLAAQLRSLEDAIAEALAGDPWLAGSEWRQESLRARGRAAGALPDPVLRLGAANLPTDSFAFNQEAMTQFQVGLSQAIPRGATRELERERLEALGAEQAERRDERRAQLALSVTELWLDSYLASRSRALIEGDRELFLQLQEVVAARYRSALGAARQQDLVRAELELTRLEDRLARLGEQEEVARSRLGEWLGAAAQHLETALPELAPAEPALVGEASLPAGRIAALLGSHPSVRSLDRRIDAGNTGVALAEERYKPGFTVNAGYGYREDAMDGSARPDFFSLGVAVELPLFPGERQDQRLRAAHADTEALRTERALLLRDLRAGLLSARARLARLDQRRDLYRSRLLKEMAQQAAAAQAAYSADDGDFAEAIRARIDELDARIEALVIDVERQRTIARLNYFLAGHPEAAQP
ncbi:TolC family protein [Pseudohaliea rubra]|uniref:Heavy metal RND efflux outer membrane protein, CzcC family n=1 Tax=Pseudohaliea rubra DSM 19751 TaxID=1265313 RepID=A0A095XTI7_9GAMM|nr:TolC family protein [Pseudohaliea rubra]KGE02971.1 Heavy metal RND efflux outer membrane protein, CzcC family [Pseudohaliea rubra DSM 19751]